MKRTLMICFLAFAGVAGWQVYAAMGKTSGNAATAAMPEVVITITPREPGRPASITEAEWTAMTPELREIGLKNQRIDAERDAREGNRLVTALPSALRKHDMDAFSKEADELLYRYQGDPREILPVLAPFLSDADAAVRAAVAERLLVAGAETELAIPALTAMVVGEDGCKDADLRMRAADALAKYRVAAAIPAITRLYEETGNKRLLTLLVDLGDERAFRKASLASDKKLRGRENVRIIGQLRMGEALPQLKAFFRPDLPMGRHPEQADIAWALYRITSQRVYLDHLIANKANAGAQAYLASIDSEEMKSFFATEIHSDNTMLAEASFLALYRFDHGSAVIRQHLMDLVTGKLRISKVPLETLYRVAAKMDDPMVDQAIAANRNIGAPESWRYYNEYRSAWPLEDLYQQSPLY